jgi:hypothetical protein
MERNTLSGVNNTVRYLQPQKDDTLGGGGGGLETKHTMVRMSSPL